MTNRGRRVEVVGLADSPGAAASSAPPEAGPGQRRLDELPGRRGSHSHLRDLNVSLIIELARQSGPISRADLARQSQISAPTVSGIVAHLLEREILTEAEVAPSSGGRPPILLQLNPKAGYVVGIKLRADGLTTVVCDLDARAVVTDEASVSLVGDPTAAIDAIVQTTRRALRDAGVRRSEVLGIGIGLPGVIDSKQGICVFSHLLHWRDAELAEPLRRRLRLPVWVDNDVKTLAVAEKWVGDGLAARDFVTLSLGRGIGLGIVIDRSLYRGAMGERASSGTSLSTRQGRNASAGDSAVSRHSSASARCGGSSANGRGVTCRVRN